jgi:hypothetical protein
MTDFPDGGPLDVIESNIDLVDYEHLIGTRTFYLRQYFMPPMVINGIMVSVDCRFIYIIQKMYF